MNADKTQISLFKSKGLSRDFSSAKICVHLRL